MASWLLATVWCLLLLGGVLAPRLGREAALIVGYAACAGLLLAVRPRARAAGSLAGAGLAAAAGFAALPAWLALLWLIGQQLGLPHLPRTSAAAAGASAWLAHVVLAPLFEELLYRERVLPALRARIGAPLALVLSSALFAAPHLETWSVLATFLVGLALGCVFLATRRVELCTAYHAGLNAAVLVCGLPPDRAALAPLDSMLAGGMLLALACWWTRGRAARPAVHATLRAPRVPRSNQARRLHRRPAWRACHRSVSGS
jgi:membrane protease YdiL (CAAX protease family)